MTLPKPYYQDDAVTLYNADCRELLPLLGKFDLLLTDPPYGIDAANMTMGSGQSSRPESQRFEKSDWDKERPNLTEIILTATDLVIWGGNYFSDILPISNDWFCWHKNNDGLSFSEFELAYTTSGKNCRHITHHWGAEKKLHATQKPLSVMRWCLKWFPDSNTIFDPFTGSGTTLVAAKLEGRKAVGIEISERYCEIAAKRLSQQLLF